MRFIDRTTVTAPASLSSPSAAVKTEADAAKLFYKTYDYKKEGAKGYEFTAYKPPDVILQLRALFKDKCAYCESELGDNMEVEHFRPKGGVHGLQHPGYWWLAHSWDNLLPSCVPCNQRRRQHLVTATTTREEFEAMQAKRPQQSYGKGEQFPVAGTRAITPKCDLAAERPLLLNPCADHPEKYLRWSRAGEYSVVLPVATPDFDRQRALSTIEVFALNRLKLVQARTLVLNELRFHRTKILEDLREDLAAGGDPRLIARALQKVQQMRRFEAVDHRFTAMAKEFVDAFAAELQDYLASRAPAHVGPVHAL